MIQEEQLHYDRRARLLRNGEIPSWATHRDRLLRDALRSSYRAWLDAVVRVKADRILDYGCGQGYHSLTLQKIHPSSEIIGIDISAESLEIANGLARGETTDKEAVRQPRFLRMDAHHLEFPDSYFPLISDFGSLSSLRWDSAVEELYRVLMPGGCLVALETLGHNPVTNLKRQFNVWRQKRTQWAARNILSLDRLKQMRKRFDRVDVQFFELTTLGFMMVPLQTSDWLDSLGQFDQFLFRRLPGLRRFAFKVLITATKA